MKLPGPLLLIAVFSAALSLSPVTEAQRSPNPDFLDGARSYTYRSVDGVTLRLHVYSPRESGSASRPAIVFFFGGGWMQGSVRQFVHQANYLANRGMVAIIADYRVLLRHGATVADAVSDAKAAISWVRGSAQTLGIDPDRIVAAGGSAGGHLAAATATVSLGELEDWQGDVRSRMLDPLARPTFSSRPNALVLFNPAVNTGKVGGSRPLQFPGDARELSPFHQVSDASVPTLILHGTADTTVPYLDVVAYCDKVDSLGGDCRLTGYERAMHGFFNKGLENDRWFTATLQETDDFLTELGYLPAK